MNLKRIFGAVLTTAGIIGLIYGAVLFMNTGGAQRDIRGIIIFAILGIIFFVTGISLVRTIKDEA